MKVWKYPKEIYDFISNNAKNMTDEEMANDLNEQYKEYDFTPQKVKMYRNNHKIRTGKKRKPKRMQLNLPGRIKRICKDKRTRKDNERINRLNKYKVWSRNNNGKQDKSIQEKPQNKKRSRLQI